MGSKSPSPFEAWLNRQLFATFGAVADEPLPPGLQQLLEEAEARAKPAGRMARADRLVEGAERAVQRQQAVIDRLIARGQDTALADALLACMVEALAHMAAQRDLLRRSTISGHPSAW